MNWVLLKFHLVPYHKIVKKSLYCHIWQEHMSFAHPNAR
jgi:hypothetical protein